jgi:hypothetical protein
MWPFEGPRMRWEDNVKLSVGKKVVKRGGGWK